MSRHTDLTEMSTAEFNDFLDALVQQGRGATPEFHRAYTIWKKTQ